MMNSETILKEIHERLVACFNTAQDLDIRPYEELSADALREQLVPQTHALLEDAVAIVTALFAIFDEDAADGSERAESRSEFRNQIADISFIGLMEFRQLADAERVNAITDSWELIAQCGDANRRIARVLFMLEAPLARLCGLEPRLDPMCDVVDAIEIRRQYARLARNVESHSAPEDLEALTRALRSVGTAIAMLVGRDIYPEIRVYDRRQIRALQTRILDWLRDEQGPGALTAGVRLWGDLVGACQMLMQINRREDLIRHDTETIQRLLTLDAPTRDMEALLTLRGLDRGLDQLIEGVPDDAAIRALLLKLSSTLRVVGGGATDGAAPSDPFASASNTDPFASRAGGGSGSLNAGIANKPSQFSSLEPHKLSTICASTH